MLSYITLHCQHNVSKFQVPTTKHTSRSLYPAFINSLTCLGIPMFCSRVVFSSFLFFGAPTRQSPLFLYYFQYVFMKPLIVCWSPPISISHSAATNWLVAATQTRTTPANTTNQTNWSGLGTSSQKMKRTDKGVSWSLLSVVTAESFSDRPGPL